MRALPSSTFVLTFVDHKRGGNTIVMSKDRDQMIKAYRRVKMRPNTSASPPILMERFARPIYTTTNFALTGERLWVR